MSQRRRFVTLLPLLAAVVSTLVVNAIPAVRAFVLDETAFVEAGWAAYFFTLPGCFLQMVVGGISSAVLALMQSDRARAIIAYSVTGLIGLTFLAMLVFVCQPA